MWLDKEQEWELADELGVFDIVRNETLTCYNGVMADGCGECPACKLQSGRSRTLPEPSATGNGRSRLPFAMEAGGGDALLLGGEARAVTSQPFDDTDLGNHGQYKYKYIGRVAVGQPVCHHHADRCGRWASVCRIP